MFFRNDILLGRQSITLSMDRFPQGYKFFRRGRMDADGRVENCLSGAGPDRYRHALNDFAGVGTDHMDA